MHLFFGALATERLRLLGSEMGFWRQLVSGFTDSLGIEMRVQEVKAAAGGHGQDLAGGAVGCCGGRGAVEAAETAAAKVLTAGVVEEDGRDKGRGEVTQNETRTKAAG